MDGVKLIFGVLEMVILRGFTMLSLLFYSNMMLYRLAYGPSAPHLFSGQSLIEACKSSFFSDLFVLTEPTCCLFFFEGYE